MIGVELTMKMVSRLAWEGRNSPAAERWRSELKLWELPNSRLKAERILGTYIRLAPHADVDDAAIVMGAVCLAARLRTKFIYAHSGDSHTVFVAVRVEKKKWVRLDTQWNVLREHPVEGTKETWIDPKMQDDLKEIAAQLLGAKE